MKFELFDFQRAAAVEVLQRLRWGRDDWRSRDWKSAFALSAMTGSGKTVIATAVIEAMLCGSADLGVEPDPHATFLWITDDPALNRQTRNKMLASSDLLTATMLERPLDHTYLGDTLLPGKVYFLNIQQLGRNAQFAQTGGDSFRSKSGWQIIGDTITSEAVDLYVVVDEAHRGMRANGERASIVRRIIDGQPGVNPPAPIVWGISATIERFDRAMGQMEGRTRHPAVDVGIDRVRASGLVKDRIELFEPDETGEFSTTLLRAAVDKVAEFDDLWASYAESESEPLVEPILVVQVRDQIDHGELADLVSVIEQQWDGLGKYAVVNVFGEHTDHAAGSRLIRYVAPETIQDDPRIRVVLAKEAISTGWDCPRAEVLYSERPASDVTHIAQVIGRMVRQPLARRIATDDRLNSVWCYLPRFRMSALSAIVAELNEPGAVGEAAELVIHAGTFARNPHIDPLAFDAITGVPCLPAPDKLANPLRRAKALATLLTDSSRGPAMLPGAGAELAAKINLRLAALAVEHSARVAEIVEDIETLDIRHTVFDLSHAVEDVDAERRSIATAAADIDRDTRRIIASVKEGVAKDYLRYVIDRDDTRDLIEARTQVAALVLVDGVIESVEAAANEWTREQFQTFRSEISLTTGARKDAFMRVQGQTTLPEPAWIDLPTTMQAPTRASNNADAAELDRYPKHLFADPDGRFPFKPGSTWETTVLEAELARDECVAWYRNPPRASTSAHRIGYPLDEDGDEWSSLQVDFLIVARRPNGDLAVSIIDPHGDFYADAIPKLRALANFAAKHGDQFARIESISEIDGKPRYLDLQNPEVRDLIAGHTGTAAKPLYDSDLAAEY